MSRRTVQAKEVASKMLAPLAVAAVVATALTIGLNGPQPIHHDLWHQMALAREAAAIGHVPDYDRFSFTPTVRPSVHHEWGAGFIGLVFAAQGSGNSPSVFNCMLRVAIGLMILWGLRFTGVSAPWGPILLVLMSPLAVFPGNPITAQTYSSLFLAILLVSLIRDLQGERWWIWGWLALWVIWLNVHGGALVGFVVLGAAATENKMRRRAWKHLAGLGAIMVCLMGLNPYGVEYFGYLFRAMTFSRKVTSDWNPLWAFQSPSIVHAVFWLSLLGFLLVVYLRGWRHVEGFLVVLVLAAISIRAQRMAAFYAIAWALTIPRALLDLKPGKAITRIEEEEPEIPALALGVFAAIALVFFWVSQSWKLSVPGARAGAAQADAYPVGAVEYLAQQRFKGNVMTSFMSGSYVSWKLGPGVKVGCDSRYEVAYPVDFVEQAARLYDRPDQQLWDGIVVKYGADLVLVERAAALAKRLEAQSIWNRVYADSAHALYARPGLDLPVVNREGQQIDGTFP